MRPGWTMQAIAECAATAEECRVDSDVRQVSRVDREILLGLLTDAECRAYAHAHTADIRKSKSHLRVPA